MASLFRGKTSPSLLCSDSGPHSSSPLALAQASPPGFSPLPMLSSLEPLRHDQGPAVPPGAPPLAFDPPLAPFPFAAPFGSICGMAMLGGADGALPAGLPLLS